MASAFAFAALYPSDAYAEWVSNSSTCYEYVVDSLPSSFKVAPVNTKYTAMSNLAASKSYYTDSTSSIGPAFNTVPSGSAYLVRMKNIANGTLAEGNRIALSGLENVDIGYTTAASPSIEVSSSYYKYRTFNATQYRYWVSASGNSNLTEIFPNEKGVFVMPFTAQYIFVTCYVSFNNMSSYTYWFVDAGFTVSYERPEDQNEVAAINDQTETLTSTEGSDTVTGDAVGDATGQIEGLQIFGLGESIAQGVSDAITTQEVDGSVTFPGMSLAGFVVPSVSVRPMELAPESLRPVIRLMVTFVFCAAFVSHIVQLLHAIFGIWEYGAGAEDFGGGSYDMGPRPVAWRSHDYGVDEDLGF